VDNRGNKRDVVEGPRGGGRRRLRRRSGAAVSSSSSSCRRRPRRRRSSSISSSSSSSSAASAAAAALLPRCCRRPRRLLLDRGEEPGGVEQPGQPDDARPPLGQPPRELPCPVGGAGGPARGVVPRGALPRFLHPRSGDAPGPERLQGQDERGRQGRRPGEGPAKRPQPEDPN
jgi:hypothetical protein